MTHLVRVRVRVILTGRDAFLLVDHIGGAHAVVAVNW